MRDFRYDIVRFTAIIFVLAIHVQHIIPNAGIVGTVFHMVAPMLLFTANAMFFFMSGKFNIKERSDDQLSIYYYRKFRNILIPSFVYIALIALCTVSPFSAGFSAFTTEVVDGFIGSYSNQLPWFIFTLSGFLLAAPFLAPSLKGMSDYSQRFFLLLGLIFLSFEFVFENMGYTFSWTYLFGNWAFAFCAGAFADGFFNTTRRKKKLLILFIVSWLLTFVCIKFGWTAGLYSFSPMYMIIAMVVLLSLLQVSSLVSFGDRCSKVISLIAKHSFGIYLLHWFIIQYLAGIVGCHGGLIGFLIYIAVVMIGLISTLVVSILVEMILIKPLQLIFDFCSQSLSKAFLNKHN